MSYRCRFSAYFSLAWGAAFVLFEVFGGAAWHFRRGGRRTRATETWCVFDNTARHAAWDDALQFMATLRRPDN